MGAIDALQSKYCLIKKCSESLHQLTFTDAVSLRELAEFVSKHARCRDSDRFIDEYLLQNFAPDETELLGEIVCECPDSTTWHIERLLAATVLLILQTHSGYGCEWRDFALAAVVRSSTYVGPPFDIAAAQLLAWASAQPMPERSQSQEIFSSVCVLLSSIVFDMEKCLALLDREFQSRQTHDYSVGPPPLLNYSDDIRSEWSAVMKTGDNALQRLQSAIIAFSERAGIAADG